MKIEKLTVRYSTTVPIAAYGVNDKFDWEITISPTIEDGGIRFSFIEEQTQELKKEGDAIVKKLYPHLFPEKTTPYNFNPESAMLTTFPTKYPLDSLPQPPVIDISKEKEQYKTIEEIISDCTKIGGVDGLESYRIFVESRKDPTLQELFDNKLKELNK